MAGTRKMNPYIKKVVAYYKAHKKEGIKYSDAIKHVAKSYKKGGENDGPLVKDVTGGKSKRRNKSKKSRSLKKK